MEDCLKIHPIEWYHAIKRLVYSIRRVDLDLQIASIALEHNAPLGTYNQKHFARFTRLARLVLEDWLG